jgi:RHS repeat-associated protein
MPVMRAIRTTDVDYNGTVNAIDLGLVQAATDPCTDGPMLDIDGNGTINATDQGLVQSSYGSAVATLYTSGLGNAYFFTGRRMHHFDSNLIDLGPAPNTAIQHNRARHYDPENGMWLQRDPLVTSILPGRTGRPSREYSDGMNLYQYTISNPTTYTDYDGLSCVAGTVRRVTSAEYSGGWRCWARSCARCRVCACDRWVTFNTPCSKWVRGWVFSPAVPPPAPPCGPAPPQPGQWCCAFRNAPTKRNCKECCWETVTGGSSVPGVYTQFDHKLAEQGELANACDNYP